MRIGELEKLTKLSRHTIRFYESEGLIAPARRAANNYREYAERTVDELKFIRQAQSLGFSLVEIGAINRAMRESRMDCAEGAKLVREKKEAIASRIEELKQMHLFLEKEQQRLEASAKARSRAKTIR